MVWITWIFNLFPVEFYNRRQLRHSMNFVSRIKIYDSPILFVEIHAYVNYQLHLLVSISTLYLILSIKCDFIVKLWLKSKKIKVIMNRFLNFRPFAPKVSLQHVLLINASKIYLLFQFYTTFFNCVFCDKFASVFHCCLWWIRFSLECTMRWWRSILVELWLLKKVRTQQLFPWPPKTQVFCRKD